MILRMNDEKFLAHAAEAVLFSMGEPVDPGQLAAAMECGRADAVRIVRELKEEYDLEERGVQILEIGGKYQLCTREKYYEALIRVVKVPKKPVLTDVLRETLAIVANRQPVTRLEIEKIRGVKSDHAINRLIEYDLICEVGRLEAPGRPALFGTTEEFLRRFGLPSEKELPKVPEEEISRFKGEAAREVRLDDPGTNPAAGEEENHED
jgi:segregation and condensation protein B